MNCPSTPAGERNKKPITEALHPVFSSSTGDVLEIGAGLGQHAAAFAIAFPELNFWPTDPSSYHRASIDSWQQTLALPNLQPAQSLDLRFANWHTKIAKAVHGKKFSAIICINVLHISPFAATEGLLFHAGALLKPGGLLYVYGPFKMNGTHTAPSNNDFDIYLRKRNPEWGLRDISSLKKLAGSGGFCLTQVKHMPANNLSLFFNVIKIKK